MNEDLLNKWNPFSCAEMVEVMNGYTKPWWLAGGHALDKFLGKTTRIHEDIDIVIPRKNQKYLMAYLNTWNLFIADGDLTIWEDGIFLESPVYDIWAMKNELFRFQIMLIDTVDNQWVFKRDPNIRRSLTSIGTLIDDVPIINPEIQLLYKFHKTNPRPKDHKDWENTYHELNDQAKAWLGQYVTK